MSERRKIPGWPDRYEVSVDGTLFRDGIPVVLKPTGHGYYFFNTYIGKKSNRLRGYVHRMVAAAFIGPCPLGLTVNHINGDKLDNRVVNLEYLTQGDNVRHATRTGLSPRGEHRGHAKLNPDAIRDIRRLWAGGLPRPRIAEQFGVNNSVVHYILKGVTWRHVT